MNNSSQTIRVGLFTLLGIALAWITFESLNGGRLFKKEGYTLVAGFANLKGLKAGDEIRMAGVKVGAVQTTRLAGSRVEAVLDIEPKVKIPIDAVASVEQSSLLGSNYLGVTFGTPGGPLLKDGDEIRTKATVDMSEVISQLGSLGAKLEGVADNIGKAFGSENGSGSLFGKLDQLVTDNGLKLTTTVSNLQEITAKIKSGEGTLGRLVNDPGLHDELLASISEIKVAAADARALMGDTKAIVADVKKGQGALGVLIYDPATAENLKATVANVRGVSDKIAKGEGTLGKLLADDGLYRDVQSTLKKADRALEGMGDSGPITAAGVVANALF